MNPMGILFIAVGLLSMGGSLFEWNFFMNHPKARFMTTLLTRTGARIFYILTGTAAFFFGMLVTFGIIQLPN